MMKFKTLKEKILSCYKTKKEYEDCALEYERAYTLILARQEANMTQEEVAKKMNTTQSVIARLEGGKHFPSLQTIHKYSIAVNRAINLHVHP